MTNQSMPGLKSWYVARNPALRAKDNDLTSTGVPTRTSEVKYSALFDDMCIAEKLAHQNLARYHYNKEFFKTDIATAIYAIESVGIPFTLHFSFRGTEES